MKRVCIVVDGVNGLTATQKKKIARICHSAEELLVLVNAYNPYFERQYFETGTACELALESFERTIEILESEIFEYFNNNGNLVRINYNYGKDLCGYLKERVPDKELIILATADLTNRHTVHIEVAKNICNPVLMMTTLGWPTKPLISAAIDPISKGDPEATRDASLVRLARHHASSINGISRVVHSRFIPGQLRHYLTEIKAANDSIVHRFIQENEIDKESFDMTNGNPEYALINYVEANGVNILVLGSTARSTTEKKYLGSTSEFIMRAKPCDLLLCN